MRKTRASKTLPAITEAEWAVMQVLWRGTPPMTANEIVAALEGAREWKPKTIHTLIRRLTAKGALASERPGREYVFRPLVEERECQLAECRSLLDRIFDGQVAPFLAAFVEKENLSTKEKAEIKRLFEGDQK